MAEQGWLRELEGFWGALSNEAKVYLTGAVLGLGLIIIGGLALTINGLRADRRENEGIRVISDEEEGEIGEVVVDMAGAVMQPGLYRLKSGARLGEGLALAGGLAAEADRVWVEKNINLAQKITDGIKIYIPWQGEAEEAAGGVAGVESVALSEEVNINTASESELDRLWGIGEKRAQDIIDGRPYSKIEELIEKKIIPVNVYEKIKDEITIY